MGSPVIRDKGYSVNAPMAAPFTITDFRESTQLWKVITSDLAGGITISFGPGGRLDFTQAGPDDLSVTSAYFAGVRSNREVIPGPDGAIEFKFEIANVSYGNNLNNGTKFVIGLMYNRTMNVGYGAVQGLSNEQLGGLWDTCRSGYQSYDTATGILTNISANVGHGDIRPIPNYFQYNLIISTRQVAPPNDFYECSGGIYARVSLDGIAWINNIHAAIAWGQSSKLNTVGNITLGYHTNHRHQFSGSILSFTLVRGMWI